MGAALCCDAYTYNQKNGCEEQNEWCSSSKSNCDQCWGVLVPVDKHVSSDHDYVPAEERWPKKCVKGDKVAEEMCEQAKPMLRMTGMTCAPACSCFEHGYKCGEGPTKEVQTKQTEKKFKRNPKGDCGDKGSCHMCLNAYGRSKEKCCSIGCYCDFCEEENEENVNTPKQVSGYVPPEERWPNKCVEGDKLAEEMCEQAKPMLRMTGMTCAPACSCFKYGYKCGEGPTKDFSKEPKKDLNTDTNDDSNVADDKEAGSGNGGGSQASKYVPA